MPKKSTKHAGFFIIRAGFSSKYAGFSGKSL